MKVIWDSVFSNLFSEYCDEWLRKRSALPPHAALISHCELKQDDLQVYIVTMDRDTVDFT